MSQNREPGGTPTGGQFAAQGHSEAGVSLTVASELPGWGVDLDDRFSDAVEEWSSDVYDEEEIEVLELLDMDYAEAEAAYGTDRAKWLAESRVEVVTESYLLYQTSIHNAAEYGSGGQATLFDPSDVAVAESPMNGEDPPDLGYLTRRCPLDDGGRDPFDPSDPDWRNIHTRSDQKYRWARAGFRTPARALPWSRAGVRTADAARWEQNGFGPAEARALTDAGYTPRQAHAARRSGAAIEAPTLPGEVRPSA